jgi:acid phosphatase type 7
MTSAQTKKKPASLAILSHSRFKAWLWSTLLLAAAAIDLTTGVRLSERPPTGVLPVAIAPVEGLPSPGPVVVAAGDISCRPGEVAPGECHMDRTANLVEQIAPARVLVPGDVQYEKGEYQNFMASYHLTWGRFKAITRPVPGNHEYETRNAAGYFDYFNGPGQYDGPAGKRDQGYYSFNVGTWHVIALNSNCEQVGCGAASRQLQWLERDLSGYTGSCVLAYWHQPRFSSGQHGSNAAYDPFWWVLYSSGADVVLGGHDHIYERFAPQTPEGTFDPERGIRQFIIGTGGKSLLGFSSILPNSEFRSSDAYGVLRLVLLPNSYQWQFIDQAGQVLDSGEDKCH